MRHALAVFFAFSFCMFAACSSADVDVPPDITAAIEEEETHEEKVRLQQEIIRRQREEMRRQDGELEDLRRQQFYNESYRRFEK
jgi:hypothetical protein